MNSKVSKLSSNYRRKSNSNPSNLKFNFKQGFSKSFTHIATSDGIDRGHSHRMNEAWFQFCCCVTSIDASLYKLVFKKKKK